ncbi:MAG: DNA/RNA nuclease SfsA [Rhodobacteraceae bacterium]|nr:DNA/RNA nuclease SfsA [Paracoccaceae bacterium]
MFFQTPLIPARLVRRYKRFLANCVLEDGHEIAAHCPNPGSMMGLAEPGTRIWLEPNDDPRKKLKFGWRLVELPTGAFVVVDTGLANRVVAEAVQTRALPELGAYVQVRTEVPYGKNSRIDLLLRASGLPDAYVEIKTVTLSRRPCLAEFPDSVTARGTKHLQALADMAASGHRAIILYLIQRTDCNAFALAGDIDPAYLVAYRAATARGVETMVIRADIGPTGITWKDTQIDMRAPTAGI